MDDEEIRVTYDQLLQIFHPMTQDLHGADGVSVTLMDDARQTLGVVLSKLLDAQLVFCEVFQTGQEHWRELNVLGVQRRINQSRQVLNIRTSIRHDIPRNFQHGMTIGHPR
jgi:hypothetical protein